MSSRAEPEGLKDLLSVLLADAKRADCDCITCRKLRRAWTDLGIPEPKHRAPVCAECGKTVEGSELLRATVAVATVGDGPPRCMLCGFELPTRRR